MSHQNVSSKCLIKKSHPNLSSKRLIQMYNQNVTKSKTVLKLKIKNKNKIQEISPDRLGFVFSLTGVG